MIQEPLQQEILTRIDKLAEKLGMAWPELVQHTVLEATMGAMVAVILLSLAGFAWYKTDGADDGWEIMAVLTSVFALLAVGIVVIYCIPTLMLPEAATIKALFR